MDGKTRTIYGDEEIKLKYSLIHTITRYIPATYTEEELLLLSVRDLAKLTDSALKIREWTR